MPVLVKAGKREQTWNTSVSYEIDNKSLKYLSRERSLVFRATPEGSSWSVKAESTFRKNVVDQYASRKFIINDSLSSTKTAVGVEYSAVDPVKSTFETFESALAVSSPQFAKINYQRA